MLQPSQGLAAADARASSKGVGLGGWWIDADDFDITKVRWFRLEVSAADLPAWMQPQVPAQQLINFFELLAQCVLLFLRLRESGAQHFDMTIHQLCDNSAAVGCVGKYFTTKAPLCFALQAIAFHASKAGATVSMSHIPGKSNILADGISRELPEILRRLPVRGEIKNFPLQEILKPVWTFGP